MSNIYVNGELRERKPCIDIEDRGYQFGDGVYDVVGIYSGQLFLMDEHLQRLERSAKELSIPLPLSLEQIKKDMYKLVEINDVKEGILYIQITRGVAPRSHEFSPDIQPTIIAYTTVLGHLTEQLLFVQTYGATAILHEDIRWLRCDIKSLNLLPNLMAKQKATEKGAVDAILHRDEVVTEASAANVFIVKNDLLYTHPANNHILKGITREKVLEISRKLGLGVYEEAFTTADLLHADEVFITATRMDIIPIHTVDDKTIGDGKPGAWTGRIMQEMKQLTNQIKV